MMESASSIPKDRASKMKIDALPADGAIMIKTEVDSDTEMTPRQTSENHTNKNGASDTNPDRNPTQNETTMDNFPSPGEQYECQVCKELFFSEWLYSLHMGTHAGVKPNNNQASSMPKIRTHMCPQCFTSFQRKSHLDQHMQTHSDLREYECKMCERKYKRKGELMRHLKTHTDERPHACSYCPKQFVRSSHLHQHMRIHSQWQEIYKDRPFVCDKCGQRFTRNADLKEHILVHTDERPHTCQWCNKAFRRKRTLKQHEKIHTGERYYCTECDKSFARPHDLEYHKETHLGFSPSYECTTCGKSFKSQSGLKFHESHHKYEQVRECPVCKLVFQDDTALQTHIAMEHADQEVNLTDRTDNAIVAKHGDTTGEDILNKSNQETFNGTNENAIDGTTHNTLDGKTQNTVDVINKDADDGLNKETEAETNHIDSCLDSTEVSDAQQTAIGHLDNNYGQVDKYDTMLKPANQTAVEQDQLNNFDSVQLKKMNQ